mmetsp:Transcript_24024/g.36960  ORF Transcript_24024/g.36960 Transcript_24024/m.36960 type:complete len:134 (-) Transcript_24024:2-403(-)
MKVKMKRNRIGRINETRSSVDLLPDVRESTSICENIIDIVDQANLKPGQSPSKNKIIASNQIGSFNISSSNTPTDKENMKPVSFQQPRAAKQRGGVKVRKVGTVGRQGFNSRESSVSEARSGMMLMPNLAFMN